MNALKQRGIALMALLTVSVMGIAFTPTTVSAQTIMFMKADGIQGSSTDSRHPGWINIASFGQSASQTVQPYSGGVTAAKVTGACDLEVLKGLDAAGPSLWLALFTGKRIPKVTIEVWMTRPAGDQVRVYEVALHNALIASMTAASAVTFAETFKLTGDKIELTASSFNANGTASGQVKTGWDCSSNTRY